MNTKEQEFKELSISFAALDKNFQELRAKAKDTSPEKYNPTTDDCMSALYACMANVHQRISSMADDMYAYQNSHAKGHLPVCPSTEHMATAIAALGWDKNYEVQKKQLFAAKDLFVVKGK